MMPPEETILDAPATPAPVFAYRAFRDLLFGSPDSPFDNDNKENAPMIQESPLKTSSPSKRPQTRFTPQKSNQNTALLSPTKSCLRNPGVLTPRAKLLRDVNVKFKSVSPEVRASSPERAVLKTGSEDMMKPVVKTKGDDSDKDKKNRTSNYANESTKYKPNNLIEIAVDATATQPQAVILAADFEEYQRRTEKEMKKLVRYSQKLREYARRQDEENLQIKKLLEEAHRENERLKKAELARNSTGSNQAKLESATGRESMFPAKTATERLTRPASMSAINNTSRNATKEDISTNRMRSNHHPDLKQSSLIANKTSQPVENPGSIKPATRYQQGTRLRDVELAVHLHRSNTAHNSTKHAPDRLAAARERVRRKAELRKVSMNESSDSQLDWAAL